MYAKVAELVDALDLGSSGVTCESSSLSFRTRVLAYFNGVVMQVSVEIKEGLKRQIKVTVPAAQVESAIKKRLAEMGKAKIKGFRAGKAPAALIDKQYKVRETVVDHLIQTTFRTALQQESLAVVGNPSVTSSKALVGEPLEYVVDVEILPKFDTIGLEGVDILRPIAVLSDADIDQGIENLRKQHAIWENVDRAAETGDQVIVDYEGFLEGVAFQGGAAKDTPIVLGAGRMIPGFEAGLLGHLAGDTFSLDITFPEKYQEQLAGKLTTFTFTVKHVQALQLPELNPAFVAKFNLKESSVEALREEVRKNLQRSLDEIIKGQLKTQVIEKLLELNHIDIPRTLVENEVSRMQQEVAHKYSRGSKEEAQKIISQLQRDNFEKQAAMNVKIGLIFGEIIRSHELKADPMLVKSHIQSMSVLYQDPEQFVRFYYENADRLLEVEQLVLEQTVINHVLKTANVTEKQTSYAALIGPTKE